MKKIDLQKIRKDNKLSQKQLSAILNVPQSFISQVETGKDPMPEYWPQQLIDRLNISDISVYEVEGDETPKIYNRQENAVFKFNDLTQLVELMKSRDELFREIVQKKDEQIERLLTLLEKK